MDRTEEAWKNPIAILNVSILSDGIVWNTTRSHSFQSLTKKQLMDLQSAKKAIVAKSRKEAGKKFYLNVDDEGEVSVSTEFIHNRSGFCYRNGSEIALPEVTQTPEPKIKGKKQIKQTVETENSDAMKKSAKKTAKKEVKKAAAPKGKGVKKELSVAAILALFDKGARIESETGAVRSKSYFSTIEDKKKLKTVIVYA